MTVYKNELSRRFSVDPILISIGIYRQKEDYNTWDWVKVK
jgi:hypothetical protein